jgi:Autographiviridae endonuclease VII
LKPRVLTDEDRKVRKKALNKRWYEANKAKCYERSKNFYANNPNKRKEISRRSILKRRAKDDIIKTGRVRPEACECCGEISKGKHPLHFDHCHKSGEFRGWICMGCNLALGHTKDSPEKLQKLIVYLQRN